MKASKSEDQSIVFYYVTILARLLRRRARARLFATAALFSLGALACLMHAAGHAAIALTAGLVAASLGPASNTSALGGRAQALLAGGGASFAPSSPHAVAFASGSGAAIVWAGVALGVIGVKAVAGVYATYVQGRIAAEVGASLRLELLDALLSVHRLRRPRHGDHAHDEPSSLAQGVAALTEQVHDVELGVRDGFIGGMRAVAQLVPLAVVLAIVSLRIALVAVLVLAVFAALLGRVRAAFRRSLVHAAGERARLLEAADDAVRHAELWVSFGAEAKARTRVAELGDAMGRRGASIDARAAALSGANEVLGAAALLVALWAARAGWLGAAAGGATLLPFAFAFFLAYRPLRDLADARLALARADAAHRELTLRVFAGAGDTSPAATEVTGPEPLRVWPLAALETRGLRLLRGACGPLDLHVEPGSIVVIVGATGVGKTTLLRTLLGFERPEEGDVLFDGASLVDAPAGPQARPFAWVPQDAPLLGDTLDGNLTLGGTSEAATSALQPLGAGHLSGALGERRLGAGGRSVSGGERQWIALARAVVTGQPVLLLDEPTNGLDPAAQARVLEAIRRLRGFRTVLLVTHRREPAEIADAVIRLGPDGALLDAA